MHKNRRIPKNHMQQLAYYSMMQNSLFFSLMTFFVYFLDINMCSARLKLVFLAFRRVIIKEGKFKKLSVIPAKEKIRKINSNFAPPCKRPDLKSRNH
jgi:hypothetical protein